ncbi:Asp-tRNA(Asn)/Glu-tRNA(Gln) amidotransferase subunit GatB [Brumimicrobium aurantiacum]|uniref:Aspartyl/glutamyl-tRNA(Asn/Gln) amidotransferase subunit B n=1 Tax=Brumimicrobium aurantiacum TaxID=1737063 RepID=A0A3E1EWF8_9FLAO|nr:Asp-tRNA(Asn)/Glu-tRNA(Gln) amidotransferase subunit GatB [Brumimicrobium aurantiacum]RFC53889.1 Asp-tRNA(Asn)/Glu-tRNA(Gln) amidotransferase subunit GatB [Brumimicrobium aurantiacum]
MVSEEVKATYEAVIGLEVHAQMLTKTKAYSSDANEYGARPNTNISAITLGHPGTLPKMNKKTIEYAIKLGLALNCEIAENQHFDRKNYYYPDLPKGYQITQDKTPICANGFIDLKMEDGTVKHVGITRIHMEEDTGKSIHDVDVYDSLVDLNRAGTPLLEIVTEPDMRSGDEAYVYLTEIRQLVRYLEICDGNMEEGNLRCDANVSVRKKGSKEFGRRVEVKNMNSMRNVQRAINFEIDRHIEAIENGEEIAQETRSFDAVNLRTISMRTKEDANDYRFFPEPDLQPLHVSQDQIDAIRAEMPVLPKALFEKYTKELKLSEYDANNIISTKPFAEYFEELIKYTKNYKSASNWMNGEVRSYLNQRGATIEEFPIQPGKLAELIELIDNGLVSNSVAGQKLFPVLLEQPNESPKKIAEELNLIQDSDEDSISAVIKEVIKQHPAEAERYKNGEKQLVGFFMGQVMKASGGKADPKSANKLMRQLLEEN